MLRSPALPPMTNRLDATLAVAFFLVNRLFQPSGGMLGSGVLAKAQSPLRPDLRRISDGLLHGPLNRPRVWRCQA